MKDNFLQIKIDTKKVILSSTSLFYKTENFIKETRYVSNIDYLLSRLAQTILVECKSISDGRLGLNYIYSVQTIDKLFTLNFVFGHQLGDRYNPQDIIFCGYIDNDEGKLSIKVDEYVKSKGDILASVKKIKANIDLCDFAKLYQLSMVSGVNLPRLTKTQKEIVEVVDKNVLVQGVAGSGKTNICIDKIIFTACKNYKGKILYTTFSRGLLADTKLKVEMYKKDLEEILDAGRNNNIIFLDGNHKKALENRLGIYFFSDDDNEIFNKIEKIISYLDNKVDYMLIEDIYREKTGKEVSFVGQNYFINVYSKNLTNHQMEKHFVRLEKYSKEIIYKEIYGMIYGHYDLDTRPQVMKPDEYMEARKSSFLRSECESVYQIAVDYYKYLMDRNLIDNNIATREILDSVNDFEYSLSIIDEVQDYTEVNLCLFKKLSLKLFCVGDALQMINPSYFNFGYLKNLIYEKGLTEIKELKYNYRNTAKIEKIIDALSDINRETFGTHNFIVKGESVDSGLKTTAVYLKAKDFATRIARMGYDNFTFVVSSAKEKEELKKVILNQEVLTVSEIKGLERRTIVAYNVLSSNIDKWEALSRIKVNHKEADENSVYRYYYNLFYVALSRAKQNIFVVEGEKIKGFENFFSENFDCLDTQSAINVLNDIVSKVEFTQLEVEDRVNEFIRLEQYDNARFMADKIKDDSRRIDSQRRIDVSEKYIRVGKYRDAGIKLWEYGMLDDAKAQFTLSGDTILIELIDKCSSGNSKDLNIDIVKYYDDIKGNSVARDFVLETVKKDISKLKSEFVDIKDRFKRSRK